VIRPSGANKFAKFVIFEVFLGQKSPYMDRSMWNLARRRGYRASSDVPNFVIIGDTCRLRGTKNRKIGPWVILIRAFLPVIIKSHVMLETTTATVTSSCIVIQLAMVLG